jgi:hypothetical protein
MSLAALITFGSKYPSTASAGKSRNLAVSGNEIPYVFPKRSLTVLTLKHR